MVIDIVFLIMALYGFYLGFSKGIIQTVFTVLSVMFGLMAAFKFSPAMTNFLETTFSDHALMFIVGFLLCFVLTMVIIRMFAKALEGALETANINIINQGAGGILLSGLMILLFSVLLWFADKSRLIDETTKAQSQTYVYLEKFPEQVWAAGKKLQPTFEDFWDHSLDFMDKVQDMSEREESETIYDMDENDPSN